MTGRHQSIPLAAIERHPTLQNRNTTTSIRRNRQEAEERAAHISRLAQDIKANGLQKPLEVVCMTAHEVSRTGKRYWLVGGHHRIEALLLTKHPEAPAIILDGEGLQAARHLSYLQNAELYRQLDDSQRTGNAWRAINDPEFDTFRRKTIKEQAITFHLTERTIDRMLEVRRRWAASRQDINYQEERAKAKKQGQRDLRAFNAELDSYCGQHLEEIYRQDYGMLKRELERGTEEATMEERQLIKRTTAMIMQALNGSGLNDIGPMRAVVKELDQILAKAKTYYEACDLADVRCLDNSSANLERYLRLQEDAPLLTSQLAVEEDNPDF